MFHATLGYKSSGIDMVSDFYVRNGARDCPGVLVFPGGAGISDIYRDTAQKLAELGYAALACDLHGKGSTETHDLKVSLPRVQYLMSHPDDLLQRARGALDALCARPEVNPRRVGTVGYCLGGFMGLDLARDGADVLATIGVHTPVNGSRGANRVKGAILVMNGAEDTTVSPEQYRLFEQEMREAKADWQLHLFGGVVHSFTTPNATEFGNSSSNRYDPRATARAWKMTCDLFSETLMPVSGGARG